MKAKSIYMVSDKNKEREIILNVIDEDPRGVTMEIMEASSLAISVGFSLPRVEMIEALEYIVKKIKTTIE